MSKPQKFIQIHMQLPFTNKMSRFGLQIKLSYDISVCMIVFMKKKKRVYWCVFRSHQTAIQMKISLLKCVRKIKQNAEKGHFKIK